MSVLRLARLCAPPTPCAGTCGGPGKQV